MRATTSSKIWRCSGCLRRGSTRMPTLWPIWHLVNCYGSPPTAKLGVRWRIGCVSIVPIFQIVMCHSSSGSAADSSYPVEMRVWENAYMRLETDDAQRLVRQIRTSRKYEDLPTLTSALQDVVWQMQSIDRAQWVLLQD